MKNIILFIISFPQVIEPWPEGTYGLPRPKNDCPATDGNFKWKLGKRTQQTEMGSYGSNMTQLFGVNEKSDNQMTQEFCMKVTRDGDGKHHFMPGKYCILKKGDCPSHFSSGSIYWDDAGSFIYRYGSQYKTGILPDGTYGRNTEIEYCCRRDGDASKEIVLPSIDPFYLLRYGESCQQVAEMNVHVDYLYFADESTLNINNKKGVHPNMERNMYGTPYTKLFYCYYIPNKPGYNYPRGHFTEDINSWSFGVQAALKIIYISGAIIGVMFALAVLLAGLQRALNYARASRLGEATTASVVFPIPTRGQRSRARSRGRRRDGGDLALAIDLSNNLITDIENQDQNTIKTPLCYPPPSYNDSLNAPIILTDANIRNPTNINNAIANNEANTRQLSEVESPPSYEQAVQGARLNIQT